MLIENPILWADMPDPDVIRVNDTYYMISTTMHLFPGGTILRSYDLVHWEIISYLYDTLEDSPGQKLEDGKGIYSAGMWAATLRYHQGTFYVLFVANDIRDQNVTYLFTSQNITGPWKKNKVKGFYHDCSLLFEGDRPFLVYGNGNIYLTEMKKDLSGPLENGIHKIIVSDNDYDTLRYEGTHFYKINGKYYLFFIHWLKYGSKRRVQACFISDKIDGPYYGNNVLDDDMDYFNAGVAQGGIVDTPDGHWFAVLFQDHGAVGRIPILVPVNWEHEWPVFGVDGKVPKQIKISSLKPEHNYRPISESDYFCYQEDQPLKLCWQWNHQPDYELWSLQERPGWLRIKNGKTRENIILAPNRLGQRTIGPACVASVHLDLSGLKNGDTAGIAVMMGNYAYAGVIRQNNQFYVIMNEREPQSVGDAPLVEKTVEKIEVHTKNIELKVLCRFDQNRDLCRFEWKENGYWKRLGNNHSLQYTLQHFMGARIELFSFATEQPGGYADFSNFIFTIIDPEDV